MKERAKARINEASRENTYTQKNRAIQKSRIKSRNIYINKSRTNKEYIQTDRKADIPK